MTNPNSAGLSKYARDWLVGLRRESGGYPAEVLRHINILEIDVQRAERIADHRGDEITRLRGALQIATEELIQYIDFQQKSGYLEYAAESQKKLDAINAVLSGEDTRAVEPSLKPEHEAQWYRHGIHMDVMVVHDIGLGVDAVPPAKRWELEHRAKSLLENVTHYLALTSPQKSGCEWCSAPTHGTARCPWEANGIRCSAGSRHQSVYNEERARFDCSACGSWARFSERTSGE